MSRLFIFFIFLVFCGGNPFLDDFKTNKLEFSRCKKDSAILFMDSSLDYQESENNYILDFMNQTYTLQLRKSYAPSPYLLKYESYNDLPTQEFVLYKTIINGVTFGFKGYTCLE